MAKDISYNPVKSSSSEVLISFIFKKLSFKIKN